MKKRLTGFAFLITFVAVLCSNAQIKLPALFTNNMVLQQKSEAPVWGWGDPGSEIRITGSWGKDTVKTMVSNDARWMVKVKTPVAVRFSFSNDAIGNLYSQEGLAVVPFRTDNW
jgi:sialate O-acetylesterase